MRAGGPAGESVRPPDGAPRGSGEGVDADVLDERLRGLRNRGLDLDVGHPPAFPGQRIFEYENALALQTPSEAILCELPSGGVQLSDLPNEILTHIFSHLPPDCHSSVALVSRRFSALISTHHAWRMAFMRHFPGHTALASRTPGSGSESGGQHASPSSHSVRSETRYFPRLMPNATWRSEYLLRTRYLRSLARGKPGIALRAGHSGRLRPGKKSDAVLTFDSHLPWRVTSIDAAFSNGGRPPRVIQGCGELGNATIADPTTGKIEKWDQEWHTSRRLADVEPGLVPYGLGHGPAVVPNVVDVSQHYGLLAGEGFLWGAAYFHNANETSGRYLNDESVMAEDNPAIPLIPRRLEAICSVWIAKSPAVVSTTNLMCGMLTGSSLGIITAYSLRNGTAGSKQTSGEVTARWAVSPGVPIISLKVDGGYCETRKSAKRVWAVALNTLGEVYYLTEVPSGKIVLTESRAAMLSAWHAGRTVCWHLLEDTRRAVRAGVEEDDLLLQHHLSWGSLEQQALDRERLLADVQVINTFLRASPAQFRKVFHGWDMRRRLEVDFAGDDGKGAGESVFVADCGLAEGLPACIRRYTRSSSPRRKQPGLPLPLPLTAPPTPSLFGLATEGVAARAPQATVEPQSPRSPPPTPKSPAMSAGLHDWVSQVLELKHSEHCVISAFALDNSSPSLLTLAEEASLAHGAYNASRSAPPSADATVRDIPGRRARFLVAGTCDGVVLTWNARDEVGKGRLQPIGIIKTESPAVTCVAASALYVVHGGNDGLVQAWDPLSSTPGPVRTICAKAYGRAPRHMVRANERFQETDLAAVGCIHLDPTPTFLQGIVSFGCTLRSWSYSSAGRLARHRKPHTHRSEPDAHLVSRRQAGLFSEHIATERAELHREEELRAHERTYLLKRFGALGDLTEEEALVYAQMISEEAFLAEKQRRASDAAAPDASTEDTASTWCSDTGSEAKCTPDLSIAGPSTSEARAHAQAPQSTARGAHEDEDEEGVYEQQIQQAIRLSLIESGHEPAPDLETSFSTEVEYTVKYKGKAHRKHPETGGEPSYRFDKYHHSAAAGASNEDEDLMLALSLSMQDQLHTRAEDMEYGVQEGGEEFPSLPGDGAGNSSGKGKGKAVQR
ncbi:F-box/WD repeat-containing protein pof10 [Escovopsis weberi]|uniref:F-box/WD repeat-containing protein pof10 n=1 Tax=Escovopsis weberi TaxID=150374 RepID=A0A0M8N7F5_ESCWE|nr:F-box/WD repeat-containing protein pof10 [Escovopsis weberi]